MFSASEWDKIVRYVTGEGSGEEREEIERWIEDDPTRRSFVREVEQAWEAADADPKPRDVDAAWERLQHRIEEDEDVLAEAEQTSRERERKERTSRRSSRRRGTRRWVSAGIVAATLLIVVAVAFFGEVGEVSSPSEPTVYTTQPGERTEVQLPDGSTVALNVDSKLRVGATFGEERRAVQIEGEAYFDVEPGMPFIVETENARVRVLGTAFGVRSYSLEEDVSVVVAEGRVGVDPTGEETSEHVLEKNQRAVVSPVGGIEIAEGLPEQYLGWREGRMVFRSTPLRKVMWELERRYDLQVWLLDSQLADRRLTATLQEESLDEVLEVVSLSLNVGYRRTDSTVVFGRSDREDLESASDALPQPN